MIHSPFTRVIIFGISAWLSLPAAAQEAPADPDAAAKAEVEAQGFRLPPQLRQVAYRDANPWVLHTNVRVGQNDSTVTFGGLGSIPQNTELPGADQTDFPGRFYDDGVVVLDGPRSNEVDANGNQTSTPGGRYQVTNSEGDLVGDFLAYTPGQTREWGYQNPEQVAGNFIGFNSFSTVGSGSAFQRDAESSGLGFELAVSRRMLRLGKKFEVSLSGSIGLSDFNAAASERITADLLTMTDVYEVFGNVPTGGFAQAPSFGVLTDPGTGLIIPGQFETTVPLQQITPDRRFNTVPNGAEIQGDWSIDGAYYSVRLGPEVRGHLTERIAITAGAGFVGAVVGSDFAVAELLDLGDYSTLRGVGFRETDSITELLVGYYAEISLEYWITQRTGLFLGAVIESIDDFLQSFQGRSAAVTLGESLVVRFGVVHRF